MQFFAKVNSPPADKDIKWPEKLEAGSSKPKAKSQKEFNWKGGDYSKQ